MRYRWNKGKYEYLQKQRGVYFEEVVFAIENGGLVDVRNYHNQTKYPNQEVYPVLIRRYIYYVPFVRSQSYISMKTIYPNSRVTKKYLRGKHESKSI